MKARTAERGVSTLEALAALALIAIVMIPLMNLQSNLARESIAQDAAARRLDAQRNALVFIDDLNPRAAPDGSAPLGDGVIMRWHARPVSEETRGRAYPAGDSAFLVTLYIVTVSLTGPRVGSSFQVERLGWRRVEEPTTGNQRPGAT